ncbi:MAG: hypothetical protein CL856_06585 [Cryomorphaceae bacterium]|nr:hypothetical protein [Cryomorphaceae bacterium]
MEIGYVIFVDGKVGMYTVWENAVNPKNKLVASRILFIFFILNILNSKFKPNTRQKKSPAQGKAFL